MTRRRVWARSWPMVAATSSPSVSASSVLPARSKSAQPMMIDSQQATAARRYGLAEAIIQKMLSAAANGLRRD